MSALAPSVQATVLAPLPELGIVSVSGADAVAFLQSQLTSDVSRLAPGQVRLSGYCTPKGRLLATFHQWRTDEAVFLRMPREIIASVVKRLSMFVLRAKAKVADVSDAWSTYGLLGENSELLHDAGLSLPDSPWGSTSTHNGRLDRVLPTPKGVARFLLTLPRESHLSPSESTQGASSNIWWLSEIDAAVPTIFAATQEKFVPQMINFEVLGGVDFKKGCYPGQEIVARSQYLGKLKRRMNVADVDASDVQAGADVFHSGASQPIGTVVMAAATPDAEGSALLFEAPLDRLESGSLHLKGVDGPRLVVRPLPYALFDPTE
ncbi:MAG TPA: folate-binding protein [Burkholderiaceae bacterium]|nr:folate-binding protein [Burkholderiaceae bacterium]